MNTPDTVKAIGAALKTADLKAERERSPVLAAAYDAATSAGVTLSTANTVLAGEKADLLAKAKALTDALEANDATIAGCAMEIAALKALYPAEAES